MQPFVLGFCQRSAFEILPAVACTYTLFLFITKQYSIISVYYNLFTDSPADGLLGLFTVWGDKHLHASFCSYMLSFLSGKYLGVERLGCMASVIKCLTPFLMFDHRWGFEAPSFSLSIFSTSGQAIKKPVCFLLQCQWRSSNYSVTLTLVLTTIKNKVVTPSFVQVILNWLGCFPYSPQKASYVSNKLFHILLMHMWHQLS